MTVRTGFLAAAWRLARNSFASELESTKFAIRVRASSICANALCLPSLRSVSNDWAPNDIALLHNRSSNVTGLEMRLERAERQNFPAAYSKGSEWPGAEIIPEWSHDGHFRGLPEGNVRRGTVFRRRRFAR